MRMHFEPLGNQGAYNITLDLEAHEVEVVHRLWPEFMFPLPSGDGWRALSHEGFRGAALFPDGVRLTGRFIEGQWRGHFYPSGQESLPAAPEVLAREIQSAAENVLAPLLEVHE